MFGNLAAKHCRIQTVSYEVFVTQDNPSFFSYIARELQRRTGWLGRALVDSPYNPLRGKWIYFFGESTLRQIWVSYAAPFQDNKFERNAKEWTRHYCASQTVGDRRKKKHVKGADYPEEGW